jgi:hypothetical protein
MYGVGGPLGQGSYFCCEQGQIGVIPTTGYAGICQAQGQAVHSSLLATLVGIFQAQAEAPEESTDINYCNRSAKLDPLLP